MDSSLEATVSSLGVRGGPGGGLANSETHKAFTEV